MIASPCEAHAGVCELAESVDGMRVWGRAHYAGAMWPSDPKLRTSGPRTPVRLPLHPPGCPPSRLSSLPAVFATPKGFTPRIDQCHSPSGSGRNITEAITRPFRRPCQQPSLRSSHASGTSPPETASSTACTPGFLHLATAVPAYCNQHVHHLLVEVATIWRRIDKLISTQGKPTGRSVSKVTSPERLLGAAMASATATTVTTAQTAMNSLSVDPLFGSSRLSRPAISKLRRRAARRSLVIRSAGSGRSWPSVLRPDLTSIP